LLFEFLVGFGLDFFREMDDGFEMDFRGVNLFLLHQYRLRSAG